MPDEKFFQMPLISPARIFRRQRVNDHLDDFSLLRIKLRFDYQIFFRHIFNKKIFNFSYLYCRIIAYYKFCNMQLFETKNSKSMMNGQQLLNARLNRNWEQFEAAEKLKVSQPYLSLLEAGKRPITEHLARRAVQVFKLPPTVLPFDDKSQKSPTSKMLTFWICSLPRSVIRNFRI